MLTSPGPATVTEPYVKVILDEVEVGPVFGVALPDTGDVLDVYVGHHSLETLAKQENNEARVKWNAFCTEISRLYLTNQMQAFKKIAERCRPATRDELFRRPERSSTAGTAT